MSFEKYTQIMAVGPYQCKTIDISRFNNRQKEEYCSFLAKRGWVVHLISPDFDVEAYLCKYAKNGVIDAKMAKHILKHIEITL